MTARDNSSKEKSCLGLLGIAGAGWLGSIVRPAQEALWRAAMEDGRQRLSRIGTIHVVAVLIIFTLAAVILHGMGRPPICTCGTIKLWEGTVNGPGNSQHLSDWYSFSHVIHGILFYAAGWLFRLRAVGPRLVIATVGEMLWEILENSPVIIDRYRAATIALGYSGDSILNSLSDGAMMVLGFLIARHLPWKATLALAIAFELFTLATIRDNLSLNILMLVAPNDAIRAWQAGA